MVGLLYLFTLHFIADFLLQDRETAKNKSSDFVALMRHLLMIYFVFLFGTLPWLGLPAAIYLSIVNVVIHGLIDAVIWKGYAWTVYRRRKSIAIREGWNKKTEIFSYLDNTRKKEAIAYLKKNFKYWEDSWFYSTIGLDQLLHFATLVVVWKLFV